MWREKAQESAGAAPSKSIRTGCCCCGARWSRALAACRLVRSRSPEALAFARHRRRRRAPGFLLPRQDSSPGSFVEVAAPCSYGHPYVQLSVLRRSTPAMRDLEHDVYRTVQPLWEQQLARVQTRTIHRPQIERRPLLAVDVAVAVVLGLAPVNVSAVA